MSGDRLLETAPAALAERLRALNIALPVELSAPHAMVDRRRRERPVGYVRTVSPDFRDITFVAYRDGAFAQPVMIPASMILDIRQVSKSKIESFPPAPDFRTVPFPEN